MPADAELHGVEVQLAEVLARQGISLTELAERVGVTVANLSVLKNGRAKAIRFSTLGALCEALDCQPGDLLRYRRPAPASAPGPEPAEPGGRRGVPGPGATARPARGPGSGRVPGRRSPPRR
jgi:putative transcriptional regulator